jgi:hypothetical protein
LIPVLFHPEAEAEFDQSIGFYEERQPGLGLDFQREVLQGISIRKIDWINFARYQNLFKES